MIQKNAAGTRAPLEEGIGRAAVVGALIGFVAVFAVCAGVMLLAGFSVGGAASVGIFTGFWGGPGLGSMFGATIHLARHESLLHVDTAANVAPEPRSSSDALAQARRALRDREQGRSNPDRGSVPELSGGRLVANVENQRSRSSRSDRELARQGSSRSARPEH